MSLRKNKYFKVLIGEHAEVFVTGAVVYTTETTLAAFTANAPEGACGFFNANTFALISGAAVGSPAAVVAAGNTRIFFALKRDGRVETSLSFNPSIWAVTYSAYSAAIAQLSVARTTGTPVANRYYAVKVLDTTPGSQPFPTWEYGVVAKTGETLVDLVTRIVALVNDTANVINKNTDPIVTAAVYNTDDIRFTALGGSSFRLAFSTDALDLGWYSDYTGTGTAKNFIGAGVGEDVVELEKAGDIMKGVTTNYPKAGTNPDDYGKPTAFASASNTYDLFLIKGEKTENSPTPVEKHFEKHQMFIAVPTGGTTPKTAVKGILGV